MLRHHLEQAAGAGEQAAPATALRQTIAALRTFMRDRPVLAQVMFERPFTDFGPGRRDLAAAAAIRELIVDRVRRCVDARILAGDPADIADVLLGQVQGLASQDSAGCLGTSQASVDRRWSAAVEAVLDGFRPGAAWSRQQPG